MLHLEEMKDCSYFDHEHLILAEYYLNWGNFADALDEVDQVSPEIQSDPRFVDFKSRIQARAEEFWSSAFGKANEMVSQFPDYLPAKQYLAIVKQRLMGLQNL